MKNERKQNLEYALEKIEEKTAWTKFLACNTRPDPRFEDQITTYISQEEEDLQATTRDCQRARTLKKAIVFLK